MPFLWKRYAVPAPDGPHGEKMVTIVQEKPADDVDGPIYEIVMTGPAGGATGIPNIPVRVWEMFGYANLPLGYHGAIERIK